MTSSASAIRLAASSRWNRARLTRTRARTILLVGTSLTVVLFVLAGLDAWNLAGLWENGHWTVTAVLAMAVAAGGVRSADGVERQVRILATVAVGLYLGGALVWDAQVALGLSPIPAPSDVLFLGTAAPFLAALALAVRAGRANGRLRTFLLDTAVLVAAVVAIVFFAFAPIAAGAAAGMAVVLLFYPIAFLGTAGAMVVAALLVREPLRFRGMFLSAVGIALLGGSWIAYLVEAADGRSTTGSVANMVGSVGVLLMGAGVSGWRIAAAPSERAERLAGRALAFLPVAAIAIGTAILVLSEPPRDGLSPVTGAAIAVIVFSIVRQTLLLGDQMAFLVRERGALERERGLRENAVVALAAREASEARYRTLVDVFNELAEQTTFATDEEEMFKAAALALSRLVPAPDGDVLVINSSADRLSVALAWGDHAREPASPVDIESPTRCVGIRRGSVHVVDEVGGDWAQACPACSAEHGSTMCVPMLAVGKLVGVIHLVRHEPHSFALDDQRQAARVAEQVALAISNARLIRTMEGLALTDAMTGLHNGRFFDPFLDRELAIADRDDIPIGLIAIDLDHFKNFNDTHGHPAGDEALRAFARACLDTLRQADTMARVGGEEFAVAIRGTDLTETVAVAEKLRIAVEQVMVQISPRRTARVTASFGVANSAVHGTDRLRLLRAADRALYDAKRQGRNVVVAASRPTDPN